MADPSVILATREQSSIAGGWTEYLCLKINEKKSLLLYTGGYESLAERDDYYNEETDSYDIPDFINGQSVVGIEDTYIIGGELQCTSDSLVIELERRIHDELVMWLDKTQWSEYITAPEVEQQMKLAHHR